MKIVRASTVLALLFSLTCAAQVKSDEAAIRNMLQEEESAWNKGDAQAYSQHFAKDGTFTNILGMYFTGHDAFLQRHKEILEGIFRGTVLRHEVVSIKFIRPDVAIVETEHWISKFPPPGAPASMPLDAQGRLHTRVLQVMSKEKAAWTITVFHNVSVRPQPATSRSRD